MNPVQPQNRSATIASIGIILVLSLFWISLGSILLPVARVHDFLNLYIGGELAKDGRFHDMHDPQVQLERERVYVPETRDLIPFVRPHFYAALLIPLAMMPYQVAFVVWIALQSALLLVCWYWAWRRFGPDAAVILAMFVPTAIGVGHGQDCVVMLLAAIASYELARRNRLVLGGLVLALALMKFHLILLVPAAMLLRRAWKMLAGFCAGAAAAVLIGLALGGVEGSICYVNLLLNKNGVKRLFPSPELMTNVHGLARNVWGDDLWLRAVLVVLVLAVFALATWNAPYERWLSASIAASLLAVPHVHGYDVSILGLPIVLGMFATRCKPTNVTAVILAVPITFLLPMAGIPWAAVPSAGMFLFLIAMAVENQRSVSPAPALSPAAAKP